MLDVELVIVDNSSTDATVMLIQKEFQLASVNQNSRNDDFASPSDALRYAIMHADNGFLAGESQEWEQILEELITQLKLRSSVGEQAYQDIKPRYHPSVRTRKLVEALNSVLGYRFELPNNNLNANLSQDRLLQSF